MEAAATPALLLLALIGLCLGLALIVVTLSKDKATRDARINGQLEPTAVSGSTTLLAGSGRFCASFFTCLRSARIGRMLIFTLTLPFALPLAALSFTMLESSLKAGENLSMMAVIHITAWLFYLVMGISWIINYRLGAALSGLGTIFGLFSVVSVVIFVIPLALLIVPVMLAIHMAQFHSSEISQGRAISHQTS